MEWDLLKLIWSSVLTVAVAIVSMLWKVTMEKINDIHLKAEDLERDLNRVKVEYVQKEEIHRIESRIDQRFMEMKEFFVQIIRKVP